MTAAPGGRRVLFAASEIFPYVKTGGLGDVVAALPAALAAQGADVRLLLPGYIQILDHLRLRRTIHHFTDFFGANARLIEGILPNDLRVWAIDCPQFYQRSGPYLDSNGRDWPDNHLRFAGLCRVAADIGALTGWEPEIIHGHDWQCGLIPVYVSALQTKRPATVTTIHNIAYQGLFPAATFAALNLPPDSFTAQGVEYFGKVGFLKASFFYADAITTVSPTYAAEIQTPEYGCGLEGLLRERSASLTGILNGLDPAIWNPEIDRDIPARYGAQSLPAKAANRTALLNRLNLTISADCPAFGVVSRLVPQKGLDLLLEAAPAALAAGAGFVVLGTGDADLEQQYAALAAKWPQQFSLMRGYDEAFAHQIIAGTDVILVPSRFEPCGLVQLYGLRYGTLPLVRRTGGLADSVEANKTGFVFDEPTAAALGDTLTDAMNLFRQPTAWQTMQRAAMAANFDWAASAQKYCALYQTLRA